MQEDGVDYLLVQFVDIHGAPKVKMVPADALDDVDDRPRIGVKQRLIVRGMAACAAFRPLRRASLSGMIVMQYQSPGPALAGRFGEFREWVHIW